KAYEFYLRANQLAQIREGSGWTLARDLYLQCTREDPNFAPAWAGLGRMYRLLAKYMTEDFEGNLRRAEEAFRKALELSPDLSVVHNYFASLEVETGRTREALLRLVRRAGQHSADPQIYAGLVLTCRYAGLLEASLAADREASRL